MPPGSTCTTWRDGFNCSNSVDIACVDSDFAFIVDDCFAANLSAGKAGDLGQQRAVLFVGNRVYNCQGLKLLGVRNGPTGFGCR